MFCLLVALTSANRRLISPAISVTNESIVIWSSTMQMRVAFLLSCLFVVVVVAVRGQGQYQCDVTAPCGCSAAQPTTAVSRVIGGEDAQTDSWPWIVSIRLFGQHFCAGSILNAQFILTAAHCLAVIGDLSQVSILAGSLTLTPSGSNTQLRAIDRVISNPAYKYKSNSNDLGLIRLKTPLDMKSSSVKPICLPSAGPALPVDNSTLVGIGWGATSMENSKLPSILQQVTVRAINSQSFGCPKIIYNPQQQFCAGLPEGGKGLSFSHPLFLSLIQRMFRHVSRWQWRSTAEFPYWSLVHRWNHILRGRVCSSSKARCLHPSELLHLLDSIDYQQKCKEKVQEATVELLEHAKIEPRFLC